MYELYSFIAAKGPFKDQQISERAGWSGNAYKGSALFIGDEQMNDNTFKIVVEDVGHAVEERSAYGLYMAMLKVYGRREAKPTHRGGVV